MYITAEHHHVVTVCEATPNLGAHIHHDDIESVCNQLLNRATNFPTVTVDLMPHG